MSIENAKAFYEKVKGDQSLQQTIVELVKEKPAELESIIIKVAGENGFQFTKEQLQTVIAETTPETGELNEAELETVAGGAATKGGYIAVSIVSGLLGCIIASAADKSFPGCIIGN